MTDVHPHDNHGHSVAAWTGVIICLIGSLIVTFGVWFGNHPMSITGGAVFLAGGVIGWAMGKAAKSKATARKGARSNAA